MLGKVEGLITIAAHGIVFAPSKAGTLQEIFQDAVRNYYRTPPNPFSPMVFYDKAYWTKTLPAAGLLKKLFTRNKSGLAYKKYVLVTSVEHGDSMGNQGVIAPGDIQWMTAGRGIIHQEMPKGDRDGRMHGFQLWANLPAAKKMTEPRYQEVKAAEIPEITDDDGTSARVVCGTFWGKRGPVEGIAADPIYLDVIVPPGRRKVLPVETSRHAFAYVFSGSGKFCNASGPLAVPTESVGWLDTVPPVDAEDRSLVLFDRGDEVVVQAGEDGIRFLLVSGKPLEEPVAWYGPIVMNTQEQLQDAFEELQKGTFLNESKQRSAKTP